MTHRTCLTIIRFEAKGGAVTHTDVWSSKSKADDYRRAKEIAADIFARAKFPLGKLTLIPRWEP